MIDLAALLSRIHEADRRAFDAAGDAMPELVLAAEAIVKRLEDGGRWFNVGAGTSGRLGVLDAAELPPTFGVDPERVVGLLAGGHEAMFRSVEGAEDDEAAGGRDLDSAGMTARDAVVGLAASGRTPYVAGGLKYAREKGALTVALVCTPATPILSIAQIPVLLDTGAEVLEGSTRMKAGTAQKLALNMLSTGVMSALGLVVDGQMVAMRPTNAKLVARAIRIAVRILQTTPERAEKLLRSAAWDLPTALVSGRWSIEPEAARLQLKRRGGSVARAMDERPEWP